MPKLAHKIAFTLAAAAALAGCESTADKQAKPAAVDDLLSVAAQRCDLQGSTQADYTARLRAALMEAETKDLRTLHNNDIAVCLDTRLNRQQEGVLGSKAIGLFYREARVLTVRDGATNTGVFSYSVTDYSDSITHKVADKIRDGETSSVTIAYRSGCGKNCRTTRVKDASSFTTYQQTPGIKTAPLKPGGW